MTKKKILVRIAAVTGILMSLLLLALVIITLFLGDKIKDIVVSQMNKQLATEVKVNGDISFSFFSHFPSASIDFNKVVIKETLPEKNDLLNCEKISLLFNVWNLLRSRYVIEKITAENGTINILVDSLGNENYNIFRKTDNASSSDFSLKINKADLQDFSILYNDDKNLQHYSFKTGNSKLEGDFSSSKFSLSVDADAFADYFKVGGIDFLPQRNLKVAGTIDCNLDKHTYSFRNTGINVNGNEFNANGSVASLPQGKNLQLKIASDQLRLEQLISLLPSEYANALAQFTSKGDFKFSFNINGLQSAASTPLITASFHLTDATISHRKVKGAFERVNVDGTFTNGNHSSFDSYELSISKFSASVDGNQVGGTLLLRDFNHPYIEVLLDGNLQLAKIYPLIQDSAIKSLDGIIDFHECFFKGALTQLSSSLNMNKISAGGKFELHDVKLVTPQAAYEKLNGNFEIRNNNIIFSNCSFLAKTSDLKFEGTVSNLLPFILSSFDRSTKLKQKIGLIGELTSHHLKWEDLVGQSNAASSFSTDDYSIPAIFYWLSGSATATIDQFSYAKFNAADLHGKILFLPDKIYFNDIGLLAEQGNISCSGSLDISNTQHSKLQITSQLNHLDITQLFAEFNNFDQTTLTDKNLKGILTASIALQSTWDDNRLNKSKLHAMADVSVANGELNNFEPMRALASFMKMKELEHIRFSKMQNQVEIKDQRIYIPAMQIFSSALNVQLSGSHGFDNIIDYKVQLNLLHLLTDKFRKANSSEDAADQTTEGFLNLYLTMTGPASDPVIKYDKKAVKQKIVTDLAEEKGNLKDALRKEFNQQSASQEQAKDWKSQEEIKYFQFEDSTETQSEVKKEKEVSATKQNQKEAMGDFKNIFKKPAPKK